MNRLLKPLCRSRPRGPRLNSTNTGRRNSTLCRRVCICCSNSFNRQQDSRFEVLNAATMKSTGRSLTYTDRCFRVMCCLHLQEEVYTDDDGSIFDRKFGEFLRVNTASHLTYYFLRRNSLTVTSTVWMLLILRPPATRETCRKVRVFQIKPALLLLLIVTIQGCACQTPIITIAPVHETCLHTSFRFS